MQGQTSAIDAERLISLTNGCVSLDVLPRSGGNITSLTDCRTGRNWLWCNPHIRAESRHVGQDYGQSMDAGGWDEVLLSISPAQLAIPGGERRAVPDHGDLVRAVWDVAEVDTAACKLVATGTVVDFSFSREIRLIGDRPRIEFDYTLTNNESFAWPWYWCAHALIGVQPGTKINLPAEQPFRLESATRQPALTETMRSWPSLLLDDGQRFDLSDCFRQSENAFAGKIFVQSPNDGAVTVTAPSGVEQLSMIYDPGVLPWLGLWINNGGWSGCGSAPYVNLGIEPATTPFDSAAEAVARRAVDMIGAGETRRWQLAVELTA